MNTFYYGDNLDILQRYVKDESVDLIYLDPPFKSDQNYNILFAEQNGSKSKAQIKAFGDSRGPGREDQSISGRGRQGNGRARRPGGKEGSERF